MSQDQANIAILIASGFEEDHVTQVQKALTAAQLSYKILAPEQGLANGWQGNGWGHYFTVDQQIATAMGSDYDLLIIPGGQRGIAKLKENLHTRRIMNHFLEAGKPVAALAEGVSLLALSPKSAGMSVAAMSDIVSDVEEAQMEAMDEAQTQEGTVLTADGSNVDSWLEAVMTLVPLALEVQEQMAA